MKPRYRGDPGLQRVVGEKKLTWPESVIELNFDVGPVRLKQGVCWRVLLYIYFFGSWLCLVDKKRER